MASKKQPLKLEDLSEVHLTASQGFLAMGKFLLAYFQRTNGKGDIATLCADVYIESDRGSGDPAALSDWAECVGEVLGEAMRPDERVSS
jgi:hypothetical protein